MVLVLLGTTLLAGGLTAGATEDAEDGLTIDPQPIDVPGTDPGITAISGEIDLSASGHLTMFETMIYKVMQSGGSWIVIVGGTLAEHAPLPAYIEVGIPAGSPVFWFGQVGGSGNPDLDPQFDRPYEFRTEGDTDIYSATMTQYRSMQIEYRLNHNPFSQGPDGPTLLVEYTPLHDVPRLQLAVGLPAGGAVRARDVEFIGMNPNNNEPAFARTIEDAQGGQLYSTEITYTITSGGSATSNLDPAVVAIFAVVLALGTAAVFWLFVRTKNRAHDYYDDDDYDDDDEEYDEDEEDFVEDDDEDEDE
ncbi:MAG: hypothetical protein FWF11_00340 [Coriobacteriia bacterium]|nr:hypothetical protein [Coriobacteriia bacterium]